MDLIEKVFLLRKVSLFQGVESDYIGVLASVATESEMDRGRVLVERGEPADGLYLLNRGRILLEGDDGSAEELGEGGHFGAWDLVDPEPAGVTARTATPVHLLHIRRSDFQDVLTDYPGLALDLLENLAKRARTLVA